MTSLDQPATAGRAERAVSLARYYLPDLVYGANDGIITTFADVFGGNRRRPLRDGYPHPRFRQPGR
jgi:hypothetical protein